MPHEIRELIIGYGHENVLATHRSTLEFTKHEHLSKTGDCILVVAADKALSDLSSEFKDALRNPNAKLTVRIEVDDLIEEIHAKGDSKLSLKDSEEMVLRKSDHISDRTLAILADKAAKDLNRQLVEKLKNPNQKAIITLIVQT